MEPFVRRLTQIEKHLTFFTDCDVSKDTKESLERYRSKGDFNKEFVHQLYEGESIEIRRKLKDIILKNNEFDPVGIREFSTEELREHMAGLFKKYFQELSKVADLHRFPNDAKLLISLFSTCSLHDSSFGTKAGIQFTLYYKTIYSLGTKKHKPYLERAMKLDDIGSFSLTELGHGSNAKGVQTTATYDPSTKEFVLNTPNELAMKIWTGSLGRHGNYTIVWAQLYTQGNRYGVHAFIVPVRDKRNHLPFPGIILGDIGSKTGHEGMDNAFLILRNYRIPKDNLLNRISDVEDDGTFKSDIESEEKRFGITMGGLSCGRVYVASSSVQLCINAIGIAIRFAAVRSQFGKPNEPETKLIEYPTHQLRLFPYIAAGFAHKFMIEKLADMLNSVNKKVHDPKDPNVAEFHALSTVSKSLITWCANEAIQQAREACGGLGFFKRSMFGIMRDNHDANVTFEGDNNVMLQQTARYLTDNLRKLFQGKEVTSPSLRFLKLEPVNEDKCRLESLAQLLEHPEILVEIMEHRTNFLLQRSAVKLTKKMEDKKQHPVDVWNDLQPMHLTEVAKSFGELTILQEFHTTITNKPMPDEKTKQLLLRLFVLYGIWRIHFDLGTFRDSDYISTKQARIVTDGVVELCKELKDDMVSILDCIMSPDEIIGSQLGHSDGDIYGRIANNIFTGPGAFERAKYWKSFY